MIGPPQVEAAVPDSAYARTALTEFLEMHSRQDLPMLGGHRSSDLPQPPAAATVLRTVTRSRKSGREISRSVQWGEPLGSNFRMITRIDTKAGGAYSVVDTVLPAHGSGCAALLRTDYDMSGSVIQQTLWVNDPAMQIPGAQQFPPDLCNYDVQSEAPFVNALNHAAAGGTGVVNLQTTPWRYFQVNVWATQAGPITVPAGTFPALKLSLRPDMPSLFPGMPRVVARTIEAFFPKTSAYVGDQPPHLLLKEEGSTGLGSPDIVTEVTEISRAPASAQTLALQRGQTNAAEPIDPRERELMRRGMLGGDMPGGISSERMPKPPRGVEVSEYTEDLRDSGEPLFYIRKWDEPAPAGELHVEITSVPTGAFETAFWLLNPDRQAGCSLYGWNMYDRTGHRVAARFWRNDPALQTPGAPQLPTSLYPEDGSPELLLRALDRPEPGGHGTINQMISSGYVAVQIWAPTIERVSLPDGNKEALKVVYRIELGTLLPSIPHLITALLEPFTPTSVLYFEAALPHRFLRHEGQPGYQSPYTIMQLVGHYQAAGPHTVSTSALSDGAAKAP